ncbi:hypothetical protein GCM10009851_33700 [Herbiconiux moechotypicola]|uniref:Uncharacterized protein n=2 Tax=Herbiconiux moechotypicola TaxID=637393 RepID=A0ABN3E019_9MICO
MGQSFSGDGRYTVFESNELLTPDAVGDVRHVYRRNTADGTLELVSRRARPDLPVGPAYRASISADGNWIAFQTTDAGIFEDDPSPVGSMQIALTDMSTGEIIRVSTPRGTVPVPGEILSAVNSDAMVSADGSHVVFVSNQPGINNHGAPTSILSTVELFDRSTGDITNVSGGVNAGTGAAEMARGASDEPVVSADGRFVAFTSDATNLGVAATTPAPTASTSSPTATPAPVENAPERRSYVYRWDSETGKSILVSASVDDTGSGFTKTDDDSYGPTISGDGSKVGFISGATNLVGPTEVPTTDDHMTDAFVRDLSGKGAAVTHRVSLVMVDEAKPDWPDSYGYSPSVVRVRRWYEPWASTTRIALAADGRSAVLTSMTPLVSIHGDCVGCQNFVDDNSALDVYQVLLTDDARPTALQPVSVKRTDQYVANTTVRALLRESTTGGGDSVADGKTPSTADGSWVAFGSLAGDLRGITGTTPIGWGPPSPGHPSGAVTDWLPIYVDGGEPDDHSEPVRTFTVAANAFNPHLHVPLDDQAALEKRPTQAIDYETRIRSLPTLGTPAQVTATSFLSVPSVAPKQSDITYGLTVTANSAGSAEVVIEFDQFAVMRELSIPPYWVKAAGDAANTVTYTNTRLNAGDTATFSLALRNTNALLNATTAKVVASINGVSQAAQASAAVRPPPPVCTQPSTATKVVAGVATNLLHTQCVSAATPTRATVRAEHGSAELKYGGGITYTPDAGHRGADSITVTGVDGYSRISDPVIIPVEVVAPPIAAGDSYTVAGGSVLTVPADRGVLANDTLPAVDSAWRVQRGYPPSSGTLSMDDATGAFTFTPADGFVGDVTFKYRVNGTGPNSAASTPIVTVAIHVTR